MNFFFSRQLDFRLSNIIIRYFWTQIFAKPFFFKILFEDMQKCYAILWNQIKKILCSSHCCLTFIAYDIAVKILVIAISWCFFRFGCDHNDELYIYHDIWIQKKNHIAAVSLCKSYESSRYYIISAILETNCFKLWILVSAFIIFFISLLNWNVKVMKVTRPILITQVVVLSCPDFCFRKCRVLLNYVR